MATGLGFFDANGVWQFGEDDVEVLMSDLLNKGQQSVSAAIAADRVRLDKFTDWTPYASAVTGFAVGTGGTALTEYRHEGDLVRVRFRFVFGASGQTFPTTPKISLPVPIDLPHSYAFLNGVIDFNDVSSTAPAPGWVVVDGVSTTVVRLAYMTGNGGTTAYEYPTPTTPFVWAAGDSMQGEFTYRAA